MLRLQFSQQAPSLNGEFHIAAGVHTLNRTVSAPRQGTGTMLFVSLARLHVRL